MDTEKQIERYWRICYLYAFKRCRRKEEAEEFAQEAYVYTFKLDWKSSIRQIWYHFLRKRFGTVGYRPNKIRWAIHNRTASLFEDKDVLENYCSATLERGLFIPEAFTMKERMISILLDAGFGRQEIATTFGHSETCSRRCQDLIEQKIADSEEFLEVSQKNRESLLSPLASYTRSLRARKKTSKALDVLDGESLQPLV